MSTVHRLGRRAQFRHDDLTVGIVRTSVDPDDPWARLSLADAGVSAGDMVTVRTGDAVRTGRYLLTFTEVVPGSRDGHVAFTIEGPGSGDASAE
jgi:hypothetical protein